jgi:dTDP-4-amino-4,6-dideoxygalactose transaminase
MIPVTKPYLPPRSRLDRYISRIYKTCQLTNQGPLVRELTERLQAYLEVDNLLLVANGTLALQVAFETLGVCRYAVTTPFTFPATSSALAWQNTTPVYAGISNATLNLDPKCAERELTADTSAIVPVHTYGNPCEVEAFERIGEARGVKLVYDASHAFAVRYSGSSVLKWGDAATLSFHATKLFHTSEGGGIVFRHPEDLELAESIINFGLVRGVPERIGINAKMSELHAAMGLAVLDDIDEILAQRMEVVNRYRQRLAGIVNEPLRASKTSENGAYFPILLDSRVLRDRLLAALRSRKVEARAYFSPSLDSLQLYNGIHSELATPLAQRVLCLPVFPGLQRTEIDEICRVVEAVVGDRGTTGAAGLWEERE